MDTMEDDNLWREDLFAILGVTVDMDREEIRQKYKVLAKKFHPDRFPMNSREQDDAKRQFSKINVAYNVLTNETKRENYLETRRLLAEHIEKSTGISGLGDGVVISETPAAPLKQTARQQEDVAYLKKQQGEDAFTEGERCFKRNSFDDAISAYQKAVGLVPDQSKYHSKLGLAYERKGWQGMAQASFKQALVLNANDPIAKQYYIPEKEPRKSFWGSLFGLFKKKS